MTNFNKNALEELEKLCRISCTEKENEEMLTHLQKILHYMEQLNELNTDDVPPFNGVLKGVRNVTRKDEIGTVLKREEFLSNAPDQIGGMVRIPPVLKSE